MKESRSATKKTTKQVIIQDIKYLVMNPLAVNYVLKQTINSPNKGTIYAAQSISNGNPYQHADITN